MQKNRRSFVLTLLIAVVAILVLENCGGVPTTPPPQPTQAPPPADKPIDFCLPLQKTDMQEVASEGVITNQVVLTATREKLDSVAENEHLILIQICPLNSTPYDPSNLDDLNNPQNPNATVIGLYELPAGRQVDEFLLSIKDKYPEVQQERNYVISSSATGSCSDPYSIGGSPYSIGGSADSTLNNPVPANQMLNQWALKSIGVSYQPPKATPNDVHVAIFDTAPSSLLNGKYGMSDASVMDAKKIDWPNAANNDPVFYLKVYDFLLNTTVQQIGDTTPAADVSNHGFFVAGQTRMVASDDQFHLLRVLGDNGCGDSYRLKSAIETFMTAMKRDGHKKVVLNLSLTARQLNNLGIPYLTAALDHAYNDGAVIIAAVGNDSTPLATVDAKIPANYDYVIGVVATDQDSTKTCYSNRGSSANKDTSAPGGDASWKDNAGVEYCAPRAVSWNQEPARCNPANGEGECRYMLISLIDPVKDPSTGRFSTKVGGWSGSSFAAAWTTGDAARAFEQSTSRDEVYCRIQKGSIMPTTRDTDLGWGIINIPNTLAATNCPSNSQ